MAHPDNKPNSEFSDRIDDLIELKKEFEELQAKHEEEKKAMLRAFLIWQYDDEGEFAEGDKLQIDMFLEAYK